MQQAKDQEIQEHGSQCFISVKNSKLFSAFVDATCKKFMFHRPRKSVFHLS